MSAERSSPVDVSTSRTFGLVTLGAMGVALPVSLLREVVPCPAQLSIVPATRPEVLGAMELRGAVVPIVDVRAGLGADTGRSSHQVVVIIADGERVVGVLADDVRGVIQVGPHEVSDLRTGDDTSLLVGAFLDRDGQVVSLLDAAGILSSPGLPTVQDAASGAARSERAGQSTSSRRRYMVARCGTHVLALDVAHVHSTTPWSEPGESVLAGDLCLGVTAYRHVEIPVIDPLVLLGLGHLDPSDARSHLVMELEDGFVALALGELLDIIALTDDEVPPLAGAGFALRRPDLLAGVSHDDGRGLCFVLDGKQMAADPDLVALSSLNTELDEAADAALHPTAAAVPHLDGRPDGERVVTRGTARAAHLAFAAGADVAVPLDQIAEILPLPTTTTPTAVGGAVLGVFVHRDETVPLVSLPVLLGTWATASAPTCLLMVAVDGGRVAFAVDKLHTVGPVTWRQTRDDGAGGHDGTFHRPLIQIGDLEHLRHELDLWSLAVELVGTPTPPTQDAALSGVR